MKLGMAAAALGSIMLLTACATNRTPLADAQPVPEDRMLIRPVVTSANPAQCIFVRDTGFLGSASYVEILINERPVAIMASWLLARKPT
jgi:hypothetical protein